MEGVRPDATWRRRAARIGLVAIFLVPTMAGAFASDGPSHPWVNSRTGPAVSLVKNGQCPADYTSSAGYCNPQRRAGACIPKVAQCPGNMLQSGNYCCEKP
jgi:hypothetical protein